MPNRHKLVPRRHLVRIVLVLRLLNDDPLALSVKKFGQVVLRYVDYLRLRVVLVVLAFFLQHFLEIFWARLGTLRFEYLNLAST